MKTTIIIPTYNEKENISKLIGEIFGLRIKNLEIIIVDDNSPDKTAQEVKKSVKKQPVYLIERTEKAGLGSAYIAGFKKAMSLGADRIIQMDADFSHNPKDIPALLQKLKENDLVIGSRKIKGGKIIGWGLIRHLMSDGAMFFSRIFLGLKTKDVTSGFRAWKKDALLAIDFDKVNGSGYAFQEEMLYLAEKKELKIYELPVVFIDRRKGKSKLGKKDILEFFYVILKLRFAGKIKL